MINSPKPIALEFKVFKGEDGTTALKGVPAHCNPADITTTYEFYTSTDSETTNANGTNANAPINPTNEAQQLMPPVGKPATLSLKLQFDGTGILYDNNKKDVSEQLKDFMNSVCHIKLNEVKDNDPYQIEVIWGKMNFRGWLTGLSIQHTLFKANGIPLRAVVDMQLKATKRTSPPTIIAPVEVDMGETYETLAGSLMSALKSGNKAKAAMQGAKLAYSVAKKGAIAGIFLNEVARENNLPNFRQVPAGSTIAVVTDKIKPQPKTPVEVIPALTPKT